MEKVFCHVQIFFELLLLWPTASNFGVIDIWPPFQCFLRRYYAICCQPLVYRNKMTPMRVALMIGGCWVIPTFISFLPIMQGWNSIGIDHLVSTEVFVCVCVCQGKSPEQCGDRWKYGWKLFYISTGYASLWLLFSGNGVGWREEIERHRNDKIKLILHYHRNKK